ncbi:lipopolysaccharide heptosyltransferase family protein [Helicobacter cholecystus]|uniref:Lipopolysaccharide heptosyltransferase family protein n=1 Tax=Helicobacter cholecystus TaxID=45498 RepID=A0A3D8IXF2_9HELI|nr:glycosyltransferase family 9 protein [Helicobacter cholecystus]RDU69947.1 lipopolysaccharide heptosyltransferase family protein [Helicobacter cholecystus]VEJ24887.1 Uncharacterised protein [Helicobacter cholecystus]
MQAIGYYIDSKIGDSVVALPAIYGLKTLHPQAKLYIFCNTLTQNLYSPFDWIEEIVLIDQHIISHINERKLDFLVSSNTDRNTICCLKKSNVPLIYTFLKPYNLFDPRLKLLFANIITKPQTIKKTLLDLVWLTRPKGTRIKLSDCIPTLKTYPHNVQTIDTFFSTLNINHQKLIMVNPFGYAAKVNLSLNEYAHITQVLLKDYFVIVPTFKDKDSLIKNTFPQEVLSHPNFCIFHNDWDLLNLVELISRIDLLISPSTGNIHIAQNLGIPSIGIFSLRDMILWGGDKIYTLINPKNPQKTLKKILALTHKLLFPKKP